MRYRQYNQAAVLDKLLTGLPEMARAMAEPLKNVDKITIVSTGSNDGKGFGASQITSDVARMVAQLPEVFESLTGVSVADLMSKIVGINSPASTNGATPVSTNGTTEVPSKAIIEGTATPRPPKPDDTQA